LSVSLFFQSILGHVYVPVIDPRVETHIDMTKAVAEGEGPAAPEVEESIAVTPNEAQTGQSKQ
jgi:hypothetical protein